MTITLYCFRPVAGLPDASPFVTKAMVLLKMAGLDYVEDRSGFSKAPKGKQPYINDDGEIVADSTFIRFHIEKKYGADFDAPLSDAQRAVGWCVEKMCEEHLYLDHRPYALDGRRQFQTWSRAFLRKRARRGAPARQMVHSSQDRQIALGAGHGPSQPIGN